MQPDHLSYVGSGPYCYANCVSMMMGTESPPISVIEFATCSPFGMQVIKLPTDELFFFDPYGWDPLQGFKTLFEAAGWSSKCTVAKDATEALSLLKAALAKGKPVMVGPIEMGYLKYQPEMKGPIGADHYVVVLGIESEIVTLHDPHGHPYATLPVSELLQAWKTDSLGYGKSYTMHSDFEHTHKYTDEEIIKRCLPDATKWLNKEFVKAEAMPPGSAGNGEAARLLSQQVEKAFTPRIQNPLIYFAIRCGVRRLSDGATCLQRIGYDQAAKIMATQARLVGSLQYPLVIGDKKAAAAILLELAPTYSELSAVLKQ